MAAQIPKNSTFTTDITLSLIDGVTPKFIIPSNETGALSFSTVDNSTKTDYMVFDTFNNALVLRQMSVTEGLNVENNLYLFIIYLFY